MVWRSKAIDFAIANSFPDKNSAKKDDKALCSNPESSRFCGLWATSAPSPRQVPVFRSRIQQVLWSSGPHSLPPQKSTKTRQAPAFDPRIQQLFLVYIPPSGRPTTQPCWHPVPFGYHCEGYNRQVDAKAASSSFCASVEDAVGSLIIRPSHLRPCQPPASDGGSYSL